MSDNSYTWRKMEMEAILSKHYNQVEIKDNKRRIMNLDLTEIPTNHNQQDNDIKSQTQPTFYACDICEFTSNDLNSLNVHLQVHTTDDDDTSEVDSKIIASADDSVACERVKMGKEDNNDESSHYQRVGSFKCKKCNKPFIRLMILINHCRREHPDIPGICPEEPLKLGLLDTLHERDLTKTTDGDIFTCGLPLCNLQFERYLSLVDHERTHAGAFICILCGFCCYSAQKLIGHSDKHHPRKSKFICRVCGFFNRRKNSLKTHMQQEHIQSATLFECDECSYNTKKKQSLHSHKRTAHGERNLSCNICGNNYATLASLYVHKKSHDPDFKKFQCKLCQSKFAYSSGLSYHTAVHTGEKPFQCIQCGSNFGSNTALSRHVKVLHAEEKDMVFKCEHCGKKFPKRMGGEYRDHIKAHTGERDHICKICDNGYFSRKVLRKHQLRKHAQILPKKPQPIRTNPENVPKLTVRPNTASATLQGTR
jgi:KRAB domain-containing zinc finger protein